MAIKIVPCVATILTSLLMSGCVKQHAKWHELALSSVLPFPYVSVTLHSKPEPNHQFIPRPPLNSHPPSGAGSASLYSSTSYSYSSGRGSSSGSDGYSRGGYLTRSEKRWLAIVVMLLFFGAPLAWLFYPSWRRLRSRERKTPVIPVPQVLPREAWDAEGLCPNCGSSMVQRMARRGRHAGKSFYGCSKYPRCTGIRQAQQPLT